LEVQDQVRGVHVEELLAHDLELRDLEGAGEALLDRLGGDLEIE
jgi:hypothetical protein